MQFFWHFLDSVVLGCKEEVLGNHVVEDAIPKEL